MIFYDHIPSWAVHLEAWCLNLPSLGLRIFNLILFFYATNKDSLALIRAKEEKVVDRCYLGELGDQEEYRVPLWGDFSDSRALIRAREEKVVDRCKLGELDDQEEYRIPL